MHACRSMCYVFPPHPQTTHPNYRLFALTHSSCLTLEETTLYSIKEYSDMYCQDTPPLDILTPNAYGFYCLCSPSIEVSSVVQTDTERNIKVSERMVTSLK